MHALVHTKRSAWQQYSNYLDENVGNKMYQKFCLVTVILLVRFCKFSEPHRSHSAGRIILIIYFRNM